jgi:hypothetical protein
MQQPETNETAAIESAEPKAAAAASAGSANAATGPAESRHASSIVVPAKPTSSVLPAQAVAPPCPTCAGAGMEGAAIATSYVYALGQIEARFPRPSVEKEMAQATGRAETTGRTDQ